MHGKIQLRSSEELEPEGTRVSTESTMSTGSMHVFCPARQLVARKVGAVEACAESFRVVVF